MNSEVQEFVSIPSRPPPTNKRGSLGWLRKNLFSTPINSILTILLFLVIVYSATEFVNWALIKADFVGDSRDACTYSDGRRHEGACWVFIGAKVHQFIFGFYPREEYWRVIAAFTLFATGIAFLLVRGLPYKKAVAVFMCAGMPVVVFFLTSGGILGLTEVESTKWGGLSLTLIIAVVGMVGALPLGILLALGRRSDMPLVRAFSVMFIEFWRGVPLITVLFMSSVMLPLFFPADGDSENVPKLMRALIGITLFQSAYMAEVIRGGLQAIPKGQYEAADALGLGYFRKNRLIIMPQALKLVIPGIVNTFIALFKDTTLVLIIGMFDLLGMVNSALNDNNWGGHSTEGYVFAASVFWMFCFAMSRYSQSLERKLETGH